VTQLQGSQGCFEQQTPVRENHHHIAIDIAGVTASKRGQRKTSIGVGYPLLADIIPALISLGALPLVKVINFLVPVVDLGL